MLPDGPGTAVDLPAVRAGFLRAAAEGVGDASAAAQMLTNGHGGPVDPAAAMVLFCNAAAQRNPAAPYALQVLEPNVLAVLEPVEWEWCISLRVR